MAFDYTGTSAGLFVRLGKLINIGQEERSAQGTLVTHIEEALGKYTATSIDRAEYLGALAGDRNLIADENGRNAQQAVRDAIERTIIEQADAESPLPLESKTIDNALRLLTIDMRTGTATQAIGTTGISISAQTASLAETATANQGHLIVSEAGRYSYGGSKASSKATQNDTVLAETITARCTKDARDGSLIRGNERFLVTGADAVDRLDRRWPQGSGAVLAINSTCASMEASSVPGQNMLSNSGFERVTSTTPLDWTIRDGTFGTSVLTVAVPYRGANGLKFVGNGTNARGVYEQMGVAPRPAMKTNTVYIVSARIRAASGTLSAGRLDLELTDGSSNTISGCTVTRNFNAGTGGTNLGTDWEIVKGTFTTPLNLPSTVRFSIYTGVALANTAELIIDEVILTEVAYLYPGGPGVAIVSGSSDYEIDDRIKVAITKTASEWAEELDRYLNLAARGIQFPSGSGTNETITTTLIA